MKTLFVTVAVAALASAPALAQGAPGIHFVENWDLDGDGQVTLTEAEERRGDVFYTFDADEDGMLSAEEYVFFDEARANDMQTMAQGRANRALQQAANGMSLIFNDTDGDGQVSQDEFIAHTADWLSMIDSNGDGVVTTDDFGPRG
ncbi:EF-hand domain-containing protein [Actibacterium sp. D379-3]